MDWRRAEEHRRQGAVLTASVVVSVTGRRSSVYTHRFVSVVYNIINYMICIYTDRLSLLLIIIRKAHTDTHARIIYRHVIRVISIDFIQANTKTGQRV